MIVNCPSKYKLYRLEENISGVSSFFKQYNAVDWSFYNYCNFQRNSQNHVNKMKQCYHDDLQNIKIMKDVPDEIKRYAGNLFQESVIKNAIKIILFH